MFVAVFGDSDLCVGMKLKRVLLTSYCSDSKRLNKYLMRSVFCFFFFFFDSGTIEGVYFSF